MKYDLIELCCGLASVSLAATGSSPAPVSRIGSKRGYTGPILEALGIEPGSARSVFMCDSDPDLVRVLNALVEDGGEHQAKQIARRRNSPARELWKRCRDAVKGGDADVFEWLLYTAGARGGVGGFKGGHIRRPSVDGFIPSRKALAERLRKFHVPDGVEFEVMLCDARGLMPSAFEPTCVFIDVPYAGRQGYHAPNDEDAGITEMVAEVATQWCLAGHRVVVSLDRPLPDADKTIEITKLRKGQTRRSMTRDSVEWISVFEP